MVGNNIGNSLSIGGRARSAAVNVVSDPGQLVRHSVGDVRAGGCAGVGADHHATVELASHDRSTSAVRRIHPLRDTGVTVCVYY